MYLWDAEKKNKFNTDHVLYFGITQGSKFSIVTTHMTTGYEFVMEHCNYPAEAWSYINELTERIKKGDDK